MKMGDLFLFLLLILGLVIFCSIFYPNKSENKKDDDETFWLIYYEEQDRNQDDD